MQSMMKQKKDMLSRITWTLRVENHYYSVFFIKQSGGKFPKLERQKEFYSYSPYIKYSDYFQMEIFNSYLNLSIMIT